MQVEGVELLPLQIQQVLVVLVVEEMAVRVGLEVTEEQIWAAVAAAQMALQEELEVLEL